MTMLIKAPACDLVIFGTKGDLARRKLLPSLYQLEKAGFLHPETKIIGVARIQWNIQEYINMVRAALEAFIQEQINETIWKIFCLKLDFCNLDINEINNFDLLLPKLNQHMRITISYCAVPPKMLESIYRGLSAIKLNKTSSRIIIEKPLGINLHDACLINNQVAKHFNENQIFRIDHYLGKEAIINLLTLRFANALFASHWDNNTIDHVQITVAEEIGIEGRWNYFDKIGQMRDMIQSHLLQILVLLAMSPPSSLTTECIRDEKLKVLRALRPINHVTVKKTVVRGQYTSNMMHGKNIPGYLEEIGANKNSHTETFIAIRVNIDNHRWTGVPFYLRTGKRLPIKYSEIVVYFKSPITNRLHPNTLQVTHNKLIIHIQPNNTIFIDILNNMSDLSNKNKLQPVRLTLNQNKESCHKGIINDYSRLLLESMRGVQDLFVSRSEIEESWKWIDTILEAWNINNDIPESYQAGTWGPASSMNMMNDDGRQWNTYNEIT